MNLSSTEIQIRATGLAFLSDHDGVITQVISDGLGLTGLIPGESVTSIVHDDSRGKAAEFLRLLREEQTAFDWELTVAVAGQLNALHFTGARIDDRFLIVAAKSTIGMASFLEELAQLDPVDSHIHSVLAALAAQARARANVDVDYYDELTRLNNELATAQRELARKNAELARLNEQKNQFLGIAAHDLRNPLDVILTYSMFVLNEARDSLDPEHLDFIERIRNSSQFMLDLVNDLLDVSRIEAGKLELDLSEVDLLALIKRNVALNQTLAERKQIRIKLVKDQHEIPRVRVDVSKIEQVLNNLIGNAVKFSPTGSQVEVAIESSEKEILVSIQDEGQGINTDELERLFRPFERGQAQPIQGQKGAGLGLAISKRIIEGHGGKVWAENLLEKGAKFVFSLPVS